VVKDGQEFAQLGLVALSLEPEANPALAGLCMQTNHYS